VNVEDNTALKMLREAVENPYEVIFTDEASRDAVSLDNLKISFLPDAVLRPQEEKDIGEILKIANRFHIPVTVRGAGSATTGSATPVKKGWVIDMSHWNQVHIDAVSGMAYVQPGATTQSIRDAAEKEGWCYPPDPSSVNYCTIGGNIACNAGGMHGAKYGVTRDYVMALEGFLPTGEWVRWGANLKKFSAGYNLRDLWIGSEGTLGIITGAVLKLIKKPETERTFLASFKDDQTALQAVKSILSARLVPAVMEFLDQQTVDCTLKSGFELPLQTKGVPAILLIELDGHPAVVEDETQQLKELLKPLAEDFRFSESNEEKELLWKIRRSCSKAMFQLGSSKLNEDIVVPLDAQIPLIEFTLQLKEETGLATPTFGHAADGNFHVHVMYNRDDPGQLKTAEAAVMKIMKKVVSLGGAISGEHGIGLAKTPFLRVQHQQAEINAMQAIKKALDPKDILNPGKIFTPFPVWEHTPDTRKMPWDH
jgi:glycolate oxidase